MQVKSVHMGQMRLTVFVRNDLVAGVTNVTRGSQATGVAGVATNKGGVAVGLTVSVAPRELQQGSAAAALTVGRRLLLWRELSVLAWPAMQIWDTEMCFINSHLAAHQDKTVQRNNNYRFVVAACGAVWGPATTAFDDEGGPHCAHLRHRVLRLCSAVRAGTLSRASASTRTAWTC